jgi:nucleotide-binding universal stress UspA family protein
MNQSTIHILVGIDFSESSTAALRHAQKLAGRMQARLHLCHFVKSNGVTAQSDLGLNVPDDFPEAKQARVALQRLLADLGSDVDGQIHLRIGDPGRGILALINELKPDLVVVCSHGYGLIKRTLLGSITKQLVEQSPVPVVVVPAPGREASLYAPEPPKERELPAVGRAVADSSGGVGLSGIGGIGGGGVVLR